MYKNWKKIVEVSQGNNYLLLLFATLDMGSKLAERLSGCFQDCFSEVAISGRIPLSVLREYAKQNDLHFGGLIMYSDAPKHFDVPVLGFSFPVDLFSNREDYDKRWNGLNGNWNFPDAPLCWFDGGIRGRLGCLNKEGPVGYVVEFGAEKFVVLQCNEPDDAIFVAPLDCVDPES